MLKIIKIKFHETFGGWLAPRVIFHLFVVPHFNFVDTANRAVARFFVTGGGGGISRVPKALAGVSVMGLSSRGNFAKWGVP